MQQYLDLLRHIKDNGQRKPAAREGMPGTTSVFGYQFRHNLADGFPLLTTKKMFWKGVVVELLWFLRGDTNIKYLLDNGVNIWNEDAYNYYVKRLYDIPANKNKNPISFEDFVKSIKDSSLKDIRDGEPMSIPGYRWGSCGHQYGKVWRSWSSFELNKDVNSDHYMTYRHVGIIDQIQNLITSLQKTPESRRHILTAIDPAHQDDLALYWCHAMVQFNCRLISDFDRLKLSGLSEMAATEELSENPNFNDRLKLIPKYYLDCQLYQRSADVVLGVPFNIASYALLTHILCEICNMVPGDYIHTFGDVHIYDDHMASVDEQLGREPRELPKLVMDEAMIEDFKAKGLDHVLRVLTRQGYTDEFHLTDYNPHPPLENKAELSTGLKK